MNLGAPSLTANPGWATGHFLVPGKSKVSLKRSCGPSSDALAWGSRALTAWGPMGPFPGTSFQTRVGIEYSFILSHSLMASFFLTGRSRSPGTGQADNLLHQEFDILLIISNQGGNAPFHDGDTGHLC